MKDGFIGRRAGATSSRPEEQQRKTNSDPEVESSHARPSVYLIRRKFSSCLFPTRTRSTARSFIPFPFPSQESIAHKHNYTQIGPDGG